MKTLLIFLTLLGGPGEHLLERIPFFSNSSTYRDTVYRETGTKDFYALSDIRKEANPAQPDIHLLNACFFFATNKFRLQNGRKELRFSNQARNAAAIHTQQMVEKNFFSHSNARNKKLFNTEKRLKVFGQQPRAWGENIALNFTDEDNAESYLQLAEKIVKQLSESPEHRQNMLSRSFSAMGCAIAFEEHARDGIRYLKATQVFVHYD